MLKPLNSYVMIEIIKEEKQEKAEIIDANGNTIPQEGDEFADQPNPCERGTVVAVGPGHVTETGVRKEMTVKVGDIVLAQKWAGTYLSEGKYYMLREESILAIE